MEMTGKIRAELRALAHDIDTVVHIGKEGITENVVKQVEDLLVARELIKGKVLENAPVTPREACDELCEITGAHGIQVIGGKFVIYRENPEDRKIELSFMKDSKKKSTKKSK